MSKSRIESFSDGVFSILITLMIFNFHAPKNGSFSAIFSRDFMGMLLVYVTSFLVIASFWIGHHMIINNLEQADTIFLWANILAIFPVSLLPFTTLTYGSYLNSPTASVLYTGNYLLANLFATLLNLFVIKRMKNHELQGRLIPVPQTQLISYLIFSIPVLFIAYFVPFVTIFLILAFTIWWIFYSIFRDRQMQRLRVG